MIADDIGIDVETAQHPQQQGHAVADGEQGHVNADVAHAVQKEHHAKQEQQMVVPGDHVLGPQVGEQQQVAAGVLLEKGLVLSRDPVGESPQGQQ